MPRTRRWSSRRNDGASDPTRTFPAPSPGQTVDGRRRGPQTWVIHPAGGGVPVSRRALVPLVIVATGLAALGALTQFRSPARAQPPEPASAIPPPASAARLQGVGGCAA